MKPPNWFCGIGISLIDDISKLPMDIYNFTTPEGNLKFRGTRGKSLISGPGRIFNFGTPEVNI